MKNLTVIKLWSSKSNPLQALTMVFVLSGTEPLLLTLLLRRDCVMESYKYDVL